MAKDRQKARSEEPTPAVAQLVKLKRYFTEAETLTYQARKNSLAAQDYYDSDQYTREELVKLHERGQPAIVINRIKPAINGIIGVVEKGQSNPRAWPRNPDDTDSADVATDVLRYIADFNRFKRLKADCFKDYLVCGTMAALVGADDDRQVTITQIRWEEFFHDPRARRPDFKDARYLGIAKWMYLDDAQALYPNKASELELTVQNAVAAGMAPDMTYQDRPIYSPGYGGAWVDQKMRRLIVIEMYYAFETGRRLAAAQRPAVWNAFAPPPLARAPDPDSVAMARLDGLSGEARVQAARRTELLVSLASALAGRAYAERRAILDHMAPDLAAQGLPAQMVSAFDPTDENLQAVAEGARQVGARLAAGPKG